MMVLTVHIHAVIQWKMDFVARGVSETASSCRPLLAPITLLFALLITFAVSINNSYVRLLIKL